MTICTVVGVMSYGDHDRRPYKTFRMVKGVMRMVVVRDIMAMNLEKHFGWW